VTRRLLVAAAAAAVLTGAAGGALAAPPELPSVPKDCHEWNELLHIQNVRSCDGDPSSEATRTQAGPPPVPVGVHVREDGSVCVGISYQVPQCTPPMN
jgi:hypothetical protein